MKHFVAFESARPIRGRYSFKVFEVKKNKLIFLTRGSIQYASTRWADSEVMNLLSSKWYIPKKYVRYYDSFPNKTFNIRYITPDDQK